MMVEKCTKNGKKTNNESIKLNMLHRSITAILDFTSAGSGFWSIVLVGEKLENVMDIMALTASNQLHARLAYRRSKY